jgi:hypothetical protein
VRKEGAGVPSPLYAHAPTDPEDLASNTVVSQQAAATSRAPCRLPGRRLDQHRQGGRRKASSSQRRLPGRLLPALHVAFLHVDWMVIPASSGRWGPSQKGAARKVTIFRCSVAALHFFSLAMRRHATGLLELLLVSQDSLPCRGRGQTGCSASRLLSSPAHIRLLIQHKTPRGQSHRARICDPLPQLGVVHSLVPGSSAEQSRMIHVLPSSASAPANNKI